MSRTISKKSVFGVLVVLFFLAAPLMSHAATTQFASGTQIQTTAAVVVRFTPGGLKIGTQKSGAKGQITGSPQTTLGFTWYKVNFATGADGWSAGNYLRAVSIPVAPPVASTTSSTPISSTPPTTPTPPVATTSPTTPSTPIPPVATSTPSTPSVCTPTQTANGYGFAGPGETNRPACLATVNAPGTLGYYASQHGLYMGQIEYTWDLNSVQNDPIQNDSTVASIQWQQFNMYEDHFSDMWCNEWNVGAGQFDFSSTSKCNWVAQQASAHNQKLMEAGYFAWNQSLPSWVTAQLTSGPGGTPNGPQLQTDLVNTIQSVMGFYAKNYPGLVQSYVVVNEPLAYPQNTVADENSIWSWIGTPLGQTTQANPNEYMTVAFQAARAADPKAVLCLNDFGNFWGQNDQRTLNEIALVKSLNATQKLVDCVGMESHLAIYPGGQVIVPSYAQVLWTMQQYAAMGVQVEVTELDLGDDNGGTAATDAQYYSTILEACLASSNCTVFNQFTVIPKYNTAIAEMWGSTYTPVLAYDNNYQPTAIFTGLINTLNGGQVALIPSHDNIAAVYEALEQYLAELAQLLKGK